MSENSKINWPSSLVAIPEMCYESLAPLYKETRPEVFGDHLAFALSCSKHFSDTKGCRGCIHKLEVTASPSFAQAKMEITHEVLPNQGACSQIITVSNRLKVACFDHGTVVPIKNFGYKKTFNCDVRAGLQHHSSPINCIASDIKGNQLASGSTNGEIALYQVREQEITFLSRTRVSASFVSGLAYLQPIKNICYRPKDPEVFNGENMLIYSTQNGHIGLMDTRCGVGNQIEHCTMLTTDPRLNISTLCLMNNLPGQTVFFGTIHGQIVSIDLRCNKRYLYQQNLPQDGCIRRMKEIVVSDNTNENKTFLAYTNETKEIRILDTGTMKPHEGWSCDRLPEANPKDLCQVEDRIVTCGAKTSIGCWVWGNPSTKISA